LRAPPGSLTTCLGRCSNTWRPPPQVSPLASIPAPKPLPAGSSLLTTQLSSYPLLEILDLRCADEPIFAAAILRDMYRRVKPVRSIICNHAIFTVQERRPCRPFPRYRRSEAGKRPAHHAFQGG